MKEGPGSGFPGSAVFGADGFIGGRLLRRWSRGSRPAVGFAQRGGEGLLGCELLQPDAQAAELRRRGVSVAVIASAITSVAACESDPGLSRKVNVEGVLELARQLRGEGIKVVFLSSDYVFDGERGGYDESAPASPVNEYGRQKAEVERRLPELCGADHLIVRLSKVYDVEKGGGRLIDDMAGRIAGGATVRAARDQIFCPTDIADVEDVMEGLVASGATGLFHVCSPERWSRHAIALHVAQAIAAPASSVEEISLADLGERFRRPRNTSMVCARLGKAFPFRFRPLRDAIDDLCGKYAGKRHGQAH